MLLFHCVIGIASGAVLYGLEFSATVLDPQDPLEPRVVVNVVGGPAKELRWSASCDAGRKSVEFCQGITSEVRECSRRVWQQMAEKEMLLALNDDEGHAKRLAEAGLTRTNRWWETTASWFPKFVADTFYFGDPLKILEIGSYEGGSTIWFQRFLLSHPNSSLLSVDTWSDARDPQSYSPTGDVGNQPTSLTQQRYLSNVKAVSNGDKVTAVKSDSARALAALLSSQNGDDDDDPQFDFVYVDGSHRASEILIDVSLAWRLLKVGGLMLLDDYLFASPAPNNVATIRNEGDGVCARTIVERLEANATVAIDTVLAAVPGGAEVLHCGYQLLVRKRASSFSGDESRQAPVVLLRGVNGHQNLFLT